MEFVKKDLHKSNHSSQFAKLTPSKNSDQIVRFLGHYL